MKKKEKEPSLFRKLIEIHWEQAKRRKALRLLEKQAWSFDFLSMLLVKAGESLGQNIALDITDKNGIKMTITYKRAAQSDAVDYFDDNIFDQLDNDAAVDHFIREHSTRR